MICTNERISNKPELNTLIISFQYQFQVQQKAVELHRKRNELLNQITDLTQKESYLINNDPSAAIRPSPTGVAGAEPVPSRKDKVK